MRGDSDLTAGTETPGKGNLRALLEALTGERPAPRQAPSIDPEKAREALKGVLRVVLARDARGERCRAALKRMGEGAVELLRALSEE